MAEIVYILCGLASIACALLLYRGYHRTGARLLLWSALCFLCLSANNILLFCDKVLFPDIYLAPWRSLSALLGLSLLLYGLIIDSE